MKIAVQGGELKCKKYNCIKESIRKRLKFSTES